MKTRVAVVGVGSFGRHHARVYRQNPEAELTGVFDQDAARAAAVAQEFDVPALASLDEVASRAQAASVAVPTASHAEVASQLIAAGLDVLVEKPVAPSLAAADAMMAAAAKHGRILMVGHLERFNPAVRAVRSRLTRPMFFEVHRLSVFTPRCLDVDVVLDLMIHDLDVVLSFVQSPVASMQAVGMAVLSRHTDIANVRLGFANGCVANLTASRVSTEKVRKLRFFQPGEYISLDYARKDAHVFAVERASSATSAAAAVGQAAMPQIAHEHLQGPDCEPLAIEIGEFLRCVRTRVQPETDGPSARAALDAALRAGRAIEEHYQTVLGAGYNISQ